MQDMVQLVRLMNIRRCSLWSPVSWIGIKLRDITCTTLTARLNLMFLHILPPLMAYSIEILDRAIPNYPDQI